MIILQIWCGDLFLYEHLKLAIDKMAKKGAYYCPFS